MNIIVMHDENNLIINIKSRGFRAPAPPQTFLYLHKEKSAKEMHPVGYFARNFSVAVELALRLCQDGLRTVLADYPKKLLTHWQPIWGLNSTKIKNLVILFLFLFINCLFAEKEMRIISLTPATTEILFALGLDKNIVAVTTYCNYPPEAENKEKIGSFSNPDIEKIFSLKPNIIFITGQEQNKLNQKLKGLGLNTFQVDPKTIKEIIVSIRDIGEITNKKAEAKVLIKRISDRIDYYKNKTKKIIKKPRVFIEIYSKPFMTVNKDTFINDIFDVIGCKNIFEDLTLSYSQISAESIVERNPEWIIVLSMQDSKDVLKRGWGSVDAIRNKNIVDDINPDVFLRPGPRVIEGMDILYKVIFEKSKNH